MSNVIAFSRGDAAHHTFSMPAASWTSGGKLFFAAKPAIDDDNLDENAVIDHEWDDSDVSDVEIDGVAYKQYSCDFLPADTNSIASNGADEADYLGEFQFVPSGGSPVTFPGDNNKLDCKVYFDVKRKTV